MIGVHKPFLLAIGIEITLMRVVSVIVALLLVFAVVHARRHNKAAPPPPPPVVIITPAVITPAPSNMEAAASADARQAAIAALLAPPDGHSGFTRADGMLCILKYVDRNHDGYITPDEVSWAKREFLPLPSAMKWDLVVKNLMKLVPSDKKIIRDCDADRDGRISIHDMQSSEATCIQGSIKLSLLNRFVCKKAEEIYRKDARLRADLQLMLSSLESAADTAANDTDHLLEFDKATGELQSAIEENAAQMDKLVSDDGLPHAADVLKEQITEADLQAAIKEALPVATDGENLQPAYTVSLFSGTDPAPADADCVVDEKLSETDPEVYYSIELAIDANCTHIAVHENKEDVDEDDPNASADS